MQETASSRLRRRRPSATVGEICLSKSSLSISALWFPSGDEFGGLWQHALERHKIRSSVLGQCILDLFWKSLCVIDGRLDFRFWPFEMFGHGGDFGPIALNEEHYLPHTERAPLDIDLAARS